MIDDCRLTIDDWGARVTVRRGCDSSIANRQSSIPPSLRRSVALSLLLLSSSIAFADQPRELIKQGNELFDAGRYAEALEAYDQIGDETDEFLLAELLNNRAAAHFKLGQLDEARELWVRAAGMRDEKFEAAARYNLGDCDYADALQAVQQQNAQGALELLARAAQQYQDALKLDPRQLDARANLELAAQLRKQIEEMAQQQPQSQPSSQPSQQNQQQQQQDQSSSQPSSQPSESDQQKQEQSDSQSQQQEQQQEGQQQPDTQPSPESQPAQQQPQPEEAEQPEDQEQQPMVPIEMTREEAERLLQMIRDAERQRRAILRAREAAKYQDVEKDW
jgi:Ca-activated chloride channel family protein